MKIGSHVWYRRAGALGGKLLGAGAGRGMLFFVPPERRAALRERLRNLLCIPFRFSTRGSEVVVYEPEPNDRSQIYQGCG